MEAKLRGFSFGLFCANAPSHQSLVRALMRASLAIEVPSIPARRGLLHAAVLAVLICALASDVAAQLEELPQRMPASAASGVVDDGPSDGVLLEDPAVKLVQALGEPYLEPSCADPGFQVQSPAGQTYGGQVYVAEPYGPQAYSGQVYAAAPAVAGGGPWQWQALPDSLIYKSYLAGVKEPRLSAVIANERDLGWFADATLGGRVGLVRYGTLDGVRPEGWQLDVEAAAFPRLNLEEAWDIESTDFRAGIPLTYGAGRWQTKFAYAHLSSHLGDEFIERNPGATRINYTRDGLVLGESFYPVDALRLYAEAAWAFHTDGGAEPWELQFGVDYSPVYPTGAFGAPFIALNGHLREEVDFGGSFVAQTGIQWRGAHSSHLLRLGLHYLNGKSNQMQFFNEHEEQIGVGMWYDY